MDIVSALVPPPNALTAIIFALQAAQLLHEDGRTRE
jgi:hypothetical protein